MFDTAIGACGIAWGERGVVGVQLPEGSRAKTRVRMVARFPGTPQIQPPQDVQEVVNAIVALMLGEAVDLSGILLDMEHVPDFHRRVYEITLAIPPGKTISYGGIANRLGVPGSAQAVGRALGHNPFAIIVPCHRVLAAGGKDGGFSANGGTATKRRMLVIEGAIADEPTLF